jgi:hypothetical protein
MNLLRDILAALLLFACAIYGLHVLASYQPVFKDTPLFIK